MHRARFSEDAGAFGGLAAGSTSGVDVRCYAERGARGCNHTPTAPVASPSRPSPPLRLPWTMPPLLDELLWPSTKGDLSTERDAQRRRRSVMPETQSLPGSPPPIAEPRLADDLSTLDDSDTPILPIGRNLLNVELAGKAVHEMTPTVQAHRGGTHPTLVARGRSSTSVCSLKTKQHSDAQPMATVAAADLNPTSNPGYFESDTANMGGANAALGKPTESGSSMLGSASSVEVAMLQNLMCHMGDDRSAMSGACDAMGRSCIVGSGHVGATAAAAPFSRQGASAGGVAIAPAGSLTERLALQMALQKASRVRPRACCYVITSSARKSGRLSFVACVCAGVDRVHGCRPWRRQWPRCLWRRQHDWQPGIGLQALHWAGQLPSAAQLSHTAVRTLCPVPPLHVYGCLSPVSFGIDAADAVSSSRVCARMVIAAASCT